MNGETELAGEVVRGLDRGPWDAALRSSAGHTGFPKPRGQGPFGKVSLVG